MSTALSKPEARIPLRPIPLVMMKRTNPRKGRILAMIAQSSLTLLREGKRAKTSTPRSDTMTISKKPTLSNAPA